MEFRNKFILIGYCIFVVVIFSNVYAQIDNNCSKNNEFCPENTTHISCTNDGIWGFDDSCESATLIRMSSARIRLLTDLHNCPRQLLASGCMDGFASASRMGVMKWDKELARIACFNVFRCIYGHDNCRNTNKFRNAGQNLFLHYSKYPNNDIESLLRTACQGWWDEHHDCDMNLMNSFQQNSDLATGHFTQMARDKSNCLGCCMGHWLSEGLHQYYLVCNYGMTNSRDRKIYAIGVPGSECKTGHDATYPALCSAQERYMSEEEEMELEYDLAHGIKTSATLSSSINASRSTTKLNRKYCTRIVNRTIAISSNNTFAMAPASAKPKTHQPLI